MNKLVSAIGLVIMVVGVVTALSTLSPELWNIYIPLILIVIGGAVAASYRFVDKDIGFHMLIWGTMTAILGGLWFLAQYYPAYINTIAFLYLALIGLAIFLTGVRS